MVASRRAQQSKKMTGVFSKKSISRCSMILSYLVVFTSTVSSYLKFVASIPMSAFTGLRAGEQKRDIGFAVHDARTPQKRFLPNRDAPADSPQAK